MSWVGQSPDLTGVRASHWPHLEWFGACDRTTPPCCARMPPRGPRCWSGPRLGASSGCPSSADKRHTRWSSGKAVQVTALSVDVDAGRCGPTICHVSKRVSHRLNCFGRGMYVRTTQRRNADGSVRGARSWRPRNASRASRSHRCWSPWAAKTSGPRRPVPDWSPPINRRVRGRRRCPVAGDRHGGRGVDGRRVAADGQHLPPGPVVAVLSNSRQSTCSFSARAARRTHACTLLGLLVGQQVHRREADACACSRDSPARARGSAASLLGRVYACITEHASAAQTPAPSMPSRHDPNPNHRLGGVPVHGAVVAVPHPRCARRRGKTLASPPRPCPRPRPPADPARRASVSSVTSACRLLDRQQPRPDVVATPISVPCIRPRPSPPPLPDGGTIGVIDPVVLIEVVVPEGRARPAEAMEHRKSELPWGLVAGRACGVVNRPPGHGAEDTPSSVVVPANKASVSSQVAPASGDIRTPPPWRRTGSNQDLPVQPRRDVP